MTPKRTLRQVGIALMLLVAFLIQGTWALAGTTGGLSGVVSDEHNRPVTQALITAQAASGTSTTTTDPNGHYVFLSLAPDTYTVSFQKAGYQPVSQGGVTVFADQTQTLELHTHTVTLTEIGHVTSKAANDLVKSGTTSDIYSVNAATAEKVAAIGGGTNLNNAYSALASQPGVTLGYGGLGWGQTVFIHGASYSQVGYEFDGVPVNRAFDNYNANTLTNLGQQELQVVTGGSPSASSSSTVGGFINQVIRTGTYPGFGNIDVGVGAPAYYHALKGEAGGATPNRLFSYYVGLLGYDQTQRVQDQFNGGSGVPNTLPGYVENFNTNTVNFPGMFPYCTATGADPNAGTTVDPGCVGGPLPFNSGQTGILQDREAVANFHIGIPHKRDQGKDDIQLLYSGSFEHQTFMDSINDQGGLGPYCIAIVNSPCTSTSVKYRDTYIYPNNVQFGALATPTLAPIGYAFPSSGDNRCLNIAPTTSTGAAITGACPAGVISPLPPTVRDGQNNDSEIVKLQYQKNIGSNAYLRAFGYTFYSDWLLNDPNWGVLYSLNNINSLGTGDYELITHTRGGELQYANQINSKNLVTLTANYTTASVSRFNNGTFKNSGATPTTNLVDTAGNCLNRTTGGIVSCYSATSTGTFLDPTRSTSCGGICPGQTANPGSQWLVTFTGPNGTLNTVTPKFSSYSLSDEFRPNDKLLLNMGLRLESFEYDLPSSQSPAENFWFNQAANSYCYDPANGNAPVQAKQTPPFFPGNAPLAVTAPGAPCPISAVSGLQTLHPNGTVQAGQQSLLYSDKSDAVLTKRIVEPRLGGTYTFNPDSVLRFSIGRYANPFNTATAQYKNANAKTEATFDFQAFFGLGFTRPEHDVQPSVSTNADMSFEHRIHGTDVSYKISPFYRYVTNQTQDSFIGPGFVSAIPTNNETAYGLEFQLSKGDPNKNGLSGQLSYTYTKAYSKFNNLGTGQNMIDPINSQIDAYNGLTATGNRFGVKGAPCYDGTASGTAAPAGFCTVSGGQVTMTPLGIAAGYVINPYYTANPQALLDRSATYPLYQTFPNPFEFSPLPDQNGTIVWPQVLAGFLNWKHDRFSITPNFQAIQGYSGGSNGGGQYGSPLSVTGIDPRACTSNQAYQVTPAGPTAGYCDYTTAFASPNSGGVLYIPNPETGRFDAIGQFQNPWLLNINAQMKYELSNRVTANLVLANIYNRCFGGSSTPWSSAEPPGNPVCGYVANPAYVGSQPGAGFFVGNSPTASQNNPGSVFSRNVYHSYTGVTSFLPFNAYLTVQFKI